MISPAFIYILALTCHLLDFHISDHNDKYNIFELAILQLIIGHGDAHNYDCIFPLTLRPTMR